jgi:hypothetical protein
MQRFDISAHGNPHPFANSDEVGDAGAYSNPSA